MTGSNLRGRSQGCNHVLTVARGSDTGKHSVIAALVSACVINPQDFAGLLDHASRFVWAVTILIIVRTVAPFLLRFLPMHRTHSAYTVGSTWN